MMELGGVDDACNSIIFRTSSPVGDPFSWAFVADRLFEATGTDITV
jgi:hypothetical protein